MENSNLKGRILMDVENLISRSCNKPTRTLNFENLHIALLKKYYNAADVSIDYHRHRIKMSIIIDDKQYDPKTANINLAVVHANLFFKNLKEFLKSCIDKDSKSLGFYAALLRSFAQQDIKLSIV
ncbi:hypothetical protein [uncultured Maribacter sp.]|uniref:hypothetical protein n=1 Tax=uncultured Maribacter sp. TaxID=431308 RepID=UPI0026044346|nr:hypothetical protein [uncultured Maribacter sp.]